MLLVNDRVDVALALVERGVDGVHLAGRSIPVAQARDLAPRSVLGASVHGPERAVEAASAGADYLIVGTVFATPSHSGRAPDGLEVIQSVSDAASGLPLLGIGGLTAEKVARTVPFRRLR